MKIKINLTPFLLGAVTAGLLATSTLAISGPHKDGLENRKAFIQSLNLTDAQREKMREIMPSINKQAHSNPMIALMPIAFADELDPLKLSLALDALSSQRRAKGLAMAERRYVLGQILDETQRDKLEARMSENMQNARVGRDPAKLFSKLDLTSEQQIQIDELTAALTDNRENMQTLLHSFKVAERDIIQAPSFDATAWVDLYDLHETNMRTSATQMVNTLHTLYTALDTEQQKKLKRMIKHKMKHMRKKA
ncbi:hypothetical protein DRW07_09675 [Alteromonas sediminis]|uniref:Periplasmic heavy metal sensor n=1 Tax=Alteromonas sediminis TaxID=2259342 RepID=A0A3N5YBI1_9ALTE|nr:Spy/CpxP family protein refolding chaperone [Alteromonas sediminis]RPJ66355.1 hypothetical protein DRW07_09675 [Alteromonas sediminis]